METIETNSAEETMAFARTFSEKLKPGDVLLLTGDLGAGKTCFCKGLAQGLEVQSEVTSPTFCLIQEYPDGKMPVAHIDLYRLDGEKAISSLGLDEFFDGDGVTVVEWSERLEEAGLSAPRGSWKLAFKHLGDDRRSVEIDRL